MNTNIRKIEKSDRNEIFMMMKEFYASPAILHKSSDEVLYRDIDECFKNDILTCFVAVVDDNIAGYMMLSKCYSTEYGGICMWVEDVYIKSEYRKQGLGNKLFDFVENEYKGKVVRYKLEVEKNNISAKRLYEKKGYKKSDYIVMTREMEE